MQRCPPLNPICSDSVGQEQSSPNAYDAYIHSLKKKNYFLITTLYLHKLTFSFLPPFQYYLYRQPAPLSFFYDTSLYIFKVITPKYAVKQDHNLFSWLLCASFNVIFYDQRLKCKLLCNDKNEAQPSPQS